MAIFTVTNTSDSGPGSLRDAIQQAENRAGPDEIEFDPGLSGQTIFVTSGPLQIRSDLNIRGLGADLLAIDGSGTNDVIELDRDGNRVHLLGLTIQNGEDGIEITDGASNNILTVTDSRVVRQAADDGLSVDGDSNSITLNNTFFEENEDNIAVETGAENNVLVMTGSTSSRAAEDGVEIDGNNNRITVLNSNITENGTVAGDPNDGLDVDGSGNLITVQQTIFDANTEDGIDIEGANNRLTVDNSTFTNNGRVGLLIQDVTSTSTATVNNSTFTNNSRAGVLVEDLDPTGGISAVTSPVLVRNAGGGDGLVGGEGDDELGGGLGNDRVEGRGGNDRLDGGGGDDFLHGGAGDDLLRGGSGVDTFRFDDDSGGFDTIQDFSRGVDRLELDIDETTFRTAFGDVVNAADLGVDALDPDDDRGVRGGQLVIDFGAPGIPGGAPGDSVLTIVGVNELFTNEIVFV